VVGFADETWWSRLARPALHTWSGVEGPLRLEELQADKDDPDPKALCCYGLLRADTEAIWLRFVQGRPGEPGHRRFPGLDLRAAGRRRAPSAFVSLGQRGLAQEESGCAPGSGRTTGGSNARAACASWSVACRSRARGANRIEPYWVHGKRAILEADRKLTAAETVERVCAYFGCENFPPLAQQLN
jgi:hypothetical protein